MKKLENKLTKDPIKEAFSILKLIRQLVACTERFFKDDNNISSIEGINSAQKSNIFDENDSIKGTVVEHVSKNNISVSHNKIKSITYYQRQDLYNKENIEYVNTDFRRHYRIIAPLKTAYNFYKNQEAYHKIENTFVERLEKSYNLDTMLKSNKAERKKIMIFNPNITKFIK